MASIAIKLNPGKMSNPDADLRYLIPKRIQQVYNESIVSDGYDYLDDDSMVIYLATDDPDAGVIKVIELLRNEQVLNNRILDSAIIGLDKGSGYTVVFPTPVTNAEYARFVSAIGHKPPRHWKGKSPPKEIADHPVTHVPWHDAVAYAEWAGKRLPTEQEWEKAARGTDGRECPWGDEFDQHKCNVKGSGIGDTTPVGKYSPAGDSPYGVADTVGNVREWTASEYRPGSTLRVLRGAAFLDSKGSAYCACRHHIERYGWGRMIGFRLVVSLNP